MQYAGAAAASTVQTATTVRNEVRANPSLPIVYLRGILWHNFGPSEPVEPAQVIPLPVVATPPRPPGQRDNAEDEGKGPRQPKQLTHDELMAYLEAFKGAVQDLKQNSESKGDRRQLVDERIDQLKQRDAEIMARLHVTPEMLAEALQSNAQDPEISKLAVEAAQLQTAFQVELLVPPWLTCAKLLEIMRDSQAVCSEFMPEIVAAEASGSMNTELAEKVRSANAKCLAKYELTEEQMHAAMAFYASSPEFVAECEALNKQYEGATRAAPPPPPP